jgi:hypothetical protein
MRFDHRRILATAIGGRCAKLKYRPVAFELLPPEFTQLQRTVEATRGRHLREQISVGWCKPAPWSNPRAKDF